MCLFACVVEFSSLSKSRSLDLDLGRGAEALIATAMGLIAAIPAVVAFNKYSSEVYRLQQQMDNFGAEFLNILDRRTAR